MFTTGAVYLPFFSFFTFLIAVPTGIKFFNWLATMWGGKLKFDTPMLYAMGFIALFLIGGLDGAFLAVVPFDFHVQDTYWVVVAHPLRAGRRVPCSRIFAGSSTGSPR